MQLYSFISEVCAYKLKALHTLLYTRPVGKGRGKGWGREKFQG